MAWAAVCFVRALGVGLSRSALKVSIVLEAPPRVSLEPHTTKLIFVVLPRPFF